ncbi:MAG: 4-hydroxybenzoate octaprenyltransferase [Burkholderiaceae bacterium]
MEIGRTQQDNSRSRSQKLPRWYYYGLLIRLHQPIGTLLLLWPTLWALWMASNGSPDPYLLFAFCTGTLLMRSAGCAVNDYADRDIDKFVKRTQARPLTAGDISAKEALVVAGGLALLAFALVLPMNKLTILLSVVALFVAVTYPYTKRFIALPQAYLGIAFGFGIPMAFAATLDSVPGVAWIMLAANICWALAYDTEYAMVDRDDDLKLNIKTAAITFGRFDVVAVMLFYAMALSFLAVAGYWQSLGLWFYCGLMSAAAMAIYHYQLIKKRSRDGCFAAFRHNNWLGAVIMAGVALDYAVG